MIGWKKLFFYIRDSFLFGHMRLHCMFGHWGQRWIDRQSRVMRTMPFERISQTQEFRFWICRLLFWLAEQAQAPISISRSWSSPSLLSEIFKSLMTTNSRRNLLFHVSRVVRIAILMVKIREKGYMCCHIILGGDLTLGFDCGVCPYQGILHNGEYCPQWARQIRGLQ